MNVANMNLLYFTHESVHDQIYYLVLYYGVPFVSNPICLS